jgi:Ca-activated chloride channel family protein
MMQKTLFRPVPSTLLGLALITAFGVLAAPIQGQDAESIDPRMVAESPTAILAVEARRRDSGPARLEPSELSVGSDGRRLEVLSIGAPGDLRDWDLVIYVDQQLTGTRSILKFLETLAPNAATLSSLGEVRIVLASEEETLTVRSSDAQLLEEMLFQRSLRSPGEHAVRYGRLRFLQSLEENQSSSEELARAALARELDVLRRRSDELLFWAAQQGPPTQPRAMLILTEGVGVNSVDFYGQFLVDPSQEAMALGGMPDLDELGRVLASTGWNLFPVYVPPAPEEDDDRVSLRTNQSIGFKVRLGKRNQGEEEEEEPLDLQLETGRLDALERLAELTGGEMASDLEQLPSLIAGIAARVPLEIERPPPSAEPVELELLARDPSVEILAPRFIGGSPSSIAEVRIRRSLDGDGDPGDMPVRARIYMNPERLATDPAELDLLVDLSDAAQRAGPDGTIPMRVSIGIHLEDDSLVIRHDVVEADLTQGTTWAYRQPLAVPPTTDAAVVVVQDLEARVWGENFAEFIRRVEEVVAEEVSISEAVPPTYSGPALQLQPLPPDTRSGKVRVRTQTRPDVAEVAFLLDGERIGSRRRAPFDLRLDLGAIPEQRSIIAIAYDDSGQEIGRDGLVVNEAATSFWIQIAEPAPSDRVGPVNIVTSLKIPEEQALERVDYYWNDRLFETTRSEPHRSRVLIPIDSPAGYIRVVATLDSGRTAEDVVLMNTQRFESSITVELVELYVVVTDRTGRPVQGLNRADFLVKEEEEVQDLQGFEIAGNLPLTLGLAIDSSLSLFKKLPDVQAAASHFVDQLESERDRALLVGFGREPRLIHPVTGNLERINSGIRSLRPSGNTAVWEGIDLALDQLQESTGRKALVVFYDGDDEDESFSFKETLDRARSSRIPIYLVVMNNEAARTDGKGFAVRSRVARLDQLARTGGGRVFYVRTDDDLTPIFDEIREELRSHYLLTYYPQRPVQHPEWRPISVELTAPDLTARTISGYGGG